MQAIRSFEKKVSLCIIPINNFTKEVYRGNIDILINDIRLKPIKKPSGIYVYTNLTDNTINLKVYAKQFKPYEKTLEINKLNPLEQVRLEPNEEYNFAGNVSGVKFTLYTSKSRVLANEEIYAYINDMTSFVALLDSDIDKNSKEVKLYNIYEEDLEYSAFRIVSEKDDQEDEYIILGKKLENGNYEIKNKLKYNHSCKDKLLNAFFTQTDCDGKAFVAFNKIYKSISKLTVEIMIKNSLKEVSFDIVENRIVDMGKVTLK